MRPNTIEAALIDDTNQMWTKCEIKTKSCKCEQAYGVLDRSDLDIVIIPIYCERMCYDVCMVFCPLYRCFLASENAPAHTHSHTPTQTTCEGIVRSLVTIYFVRPFKSIVRMWIIVLFMRETTKSARRAATIHNSQFNTIPCTRALSMREIVLR